MKNPRKRTTHIHAHTHIYTQSNLKNFRYTQSNLKNFRKSNKIPYIKKKLLALKTIFVNLKKCNEIRKDFRHLKKKSIIFDKTPMNID